jgi:dihydropyrimidine dehydrogenase (NAD+) subunit PreA
MVNLELFTTKSRRAWLERDLEVASEGEGRLIASILALPDPQDTARLAEEVAATDCVDMLELNVSCPMPASTVGMHIGKDPEKTSEQVAAVKSATSLPLSVKLTPMAADISSVAIACEEAGAEALTVSNSVRAFAGVDIYRGKPVLGAFGGYTGPAIKPIVQRLVIEVAQACDLPISAVGGITCWEDVVEYVMLGATTVQTATAVMWRGRRTLSDLVRGLEAFMVNEGYRSLDEIRGMALPHIATVEQLAKEPAQFPAVDGQLCTLCGVCVRSCFYDALELTDECLVVDEERCDGCGLCVLLCPTDAIVLRGYHE